MHIFPIFLIRVGITEVFQLSSYKIPQILDEYQLNRSNDRIGFDPIFINDRP